MAGLARWSGWLARGALAVGVWAVAAAEVGGERAAPRVGRKDRLETLSSSGLFLAHGVEQAGRAVLVTRAEAVREEVVRLLDRAEARRDDAVVPGAETVGETEWLTIHLWLRGDAQPPVHPRLYRVEGVAAPVLGLVVARPGLAESAEFRRELIRLLLVERIYRSQPAEAGRGEVLPAWLETGVREALDHVRAGRPSERFASLFAQGRILGVEEILQARPDGLEAGARDAYAASAGCLVMALLEQPEGPERFQRLLEAVPARAGSWQSLVVRQFPGMALSRNSLEKWWALQAAALATPDLLEPMTAAETDRLLAQALRVRVRPDATPGRAAGESPVVRWFKSWVPGRGKAAPEPPEPTEPAAAATGEEQIIELTELDRIAALPDRQALLRTNQAALVGLQVRAFPLHRPIIESYQEIIALLSQGKTKGLAARCEELAARRNDVVAAAEASTDLLNWYEATQREHPSGTFDRYFQLLETPPVPPATSAGDPIGRSLDELEEEFSRE